MAELTYRDAVARAIAQEMRRDENVVFLGEDIGAAGGVFKATGNASPATVPAKGRWMNADLARWAKRFGTPFNRNPYFPINTLHLMRGATGLIEDTHTGNLPLSFTQRFS